MHPALYLRGFPNVAFEMIPVFVWLMMALSRPFKEDHLALSLSTPLSSRQLIAFGFASAGSFSSSSTFQIFREASHLWAAGLDTFLFHMWRAELVGKNDVHEPPVLMRKYDLTKLQPLANKILWLMGVGLKPYHHLAKPVHWWLQ